MEVLVMFLSTFYSHTARWNGTVVHNQTTCGAVIASTFKDPLTSRRIMTKIVQKVPPHMRYIYFFFNTSRARTELNYEIKD